MGITISLNTYEPCHHNEINECDEIENCLESSGLVPIFAQCNAYLPSICRWSCDDIFILPYGNGFA